MAISGNLPYELQYWGQSITGSQNITKHVVSIDKFTDVGTGEIVSAKLMLDARGGNFITKDRAPGEIDATTPIIKQYDVLQLKVGTLKNTTDSYERFLIVDNIIPIINNQGQFLDLELFGRERYLQKMIFPGHFYYRHFEWNAQQIIDFYNANKGAKQPKFNLTFPKRFRHTWGIFDFQEETNCYDALMEIVKRLTLPHGGGGAGEYYGLTFRETNISSDIECRIAPQGHYPTNPANIETLEDPVRLTELKEASKASLVIVKGQAGFGSLPREPSYFRGYLEEYLNIPAWQSGFAYAVGALIRWKGAVYERKNTLTSSEGNPTTAPSVWGKLSLKQYIDKYEDNFDPSPWTKGRANDYLQYCGNPNGGTRNYVEDDKNQYIPAYSSPCFGDSNWVIRDTGGGKQIFRDYVDFKLSNISQSVLDEHLYHGRGSIQSETSRQYEGMRVLCDGRPSLNNSFTKQFYDSSKGGWQEDVLGVSFENNFATIGEQGEWVVFRQSQEGDECVVWYEGRVYQYDGDYGGVTVRSQTFTLVGPIGGSIASLTKRSGWKDVSGAFLGNECWHYPDVVGNVDGIFKPEGVDLGDLADKSALIISYKYQPFQSLVEPVTEAVQEARDWLNRTYDLLAGNNFLSFWTSVDRMIKGLNTIPEDEDIPKTTADRIKSTQIYDMGWWVTLFSTPFPRTTYLTGERQVGDIFGGEILDPDNPLTRPVPVLDLNNLNYTPSGKVGFNQEDSENLGRISGFRFHFQFDIHGVLASLDGFDNFRGNLPFRCCIETTRGDLMICDKNVRYQKKAQVMDFAISDFKPYRARAPEALSIERAGDILINPELLSTNIFERRKIKRITFQLLLSYDSEGRYSIFNFNRALRELSAAVNVNGVRFIGKIDNFYFYKDAYAIARNDTKDTYTETAKLTDIDNYHLTTTIKRYPNISNMAQLKKIATAELDLQNFQHDKWSAVYYDYIGPGSEDRVKLKDENLIGERDDDDKTNKLRDLIVKKITYSVGDSRQGGVTATMELYQKVKPRSG